MVEFLMANKDLWMLPFNFFGIITNLYEKRICFMVWWPTNFVFVYYAYDKEVYSLAIMQFIYAVMNLWGLYKWRHKPWLFSKKEAPK